MALRRAKPTPPSFSSNVSASTASPLMRLSALLDARDVVMCVVDGLVVTENDDTDEAARATVVAATIDSFVMIFLLLARNIMAIVPSPSIAKVSAQLMQPATMCVRGGRGGKFIYE